VFRYVLSAVASAFATTILINLLRLLIPVGRITYIVLAQT